MKRYFIFLLAFIFINSIIGTKILQAAADESETVSLHLDQETVERGYPVSSADSLFQLLVMPGIFFEPVNVEVSPHSGSTVLLKAYAFSIKKNNAIPLIKKPLVGIFHIPTHIDSPYVRMYYLHQPSATWLALSSRFDREKRRIMSSAIDFGEGIIGIVAGDYPLPDRLDAVLQKKNPDPVVAGASFITLTLGEDIIEKGYTIKVGDAVLAIFPNVLAVKSTLTASWDGEHFDFDLQSQDLTPPLQEGKMLTITLPEKTGGYHDQSIGIWDKTANNWRTLPSSYIYGSNRVRTQTPFTFGMYSVLENEQVYLGQASWFPDSLISQTSYAAANNDYEYGQMVRVTNIENGKHVDVKILSTGPFVEGRIIDLTRTAFSQIANPRRGVVEVRVYALE